MCRAILFFSYFSLIKSVSIALHLKNIGIMSSHGEEQGEQPNITESMTLTEFICETRNEEACNEMMFSADVFKSEVMCLLCKKKCKRYRNKFVCTERIQVGGGISKKKITTRQCYFEKSIRNGSIFEDAKSPFEDILYVMATYLCHEPPHADLIEGVDLSAKTIAYWRQIVRDIVVYIMDKELEANKLGGSKDATSRNPDIIEIDEAALGRYYNDNDERCILWVLGMKERTRLKRSYAFVVFDRTASTLERFVTKYVAPHARIYTDCFSAYNNVQRWGEWTYKHDYVNHSISFLDKTNKNVHTQNVEREWREYRKYIPKNGAPAYLLDEFLALAMFKKNREFDKYLPDFFKGVKEYQQHYLRRKWHQRDYDIWFQLNEQELKPQAEKKPEIKGEMDLFRPHSKENCRNKWIPKEKKRKQKQRSKKQKQTSDSEQSDDVTSESEQSSEEENLSDLTADDDESNDPEMSNDPEWTPKNKAAGKTL